MEKSGLSFIEWAAGKKRPWMQLKGTKKPSHIISVEAFSDFFRCFSGEREIKGKSHGTKKYFAINLTKEKKFADDEKKGKWINEGENTVKLGIM